MTLGLLLIISITTYITITIKIIIANTIAIITVTMGRQLGMMFCSIKVNACNVHNF